MGGIFSQLLKPLQQLWGWVIEVARADADAIQAIVAMLGILVGFAVWLFNRLRRQRTAEQISARPDLQPFDLIKPVSNDVVQQGFRQPG